MGNDEHPSKPHLTPMSETQATLLASPCPITLDLQPPLELAVYVTRHQCCLLSRMRAGVLGKRGTTAS